MWHMIPPEDELLGGGAIASSSLQELVDEGHRLLLEDENLRSSRSQEKPKKRKSEGVAGNAGSTRLSKRGGRGGRGQMPKASRGRGRKKHG
mmetsp:Transcript_14581/g.55091  ORF Transcript_14581/g.55091 Transcript_14581/m.55091 type:complete len:91 (+) Transcript_14581:858-1130(+)